LPFAAVNVSPDRAVPEIVGGAVLAGVLADTAPLIDELAVAEPSALVAVTSTRTRLPTCASVKVNVGDVAPMISEHVLAAVELQLSHWYMYPVGSSDQVPVDAVRVWPDRSVPVIAGMTSLTGGDGACTAVGTDSDSAYP
jgi:hypothetical protein